MLALCKVRNTFLSFLYIRTKCSNLGYMGKRQHPKDEILGAELKGKGVSWNINGRNIKPRRQENLNGEMGQCGKPKRTVLRVMQESIIKGITWQIGREVKTEKTEVYNR